MSLGITWYTIEEAAAKYCLKTSQILKWIEEGLIRSEQDDTRAMRINSDDLALNVQEKTGI
jgi:excisionase family DNA binding protein